jgi:hypothetical protein
MGTLDIPEIFIVVGLIAGVAWAVYNWTHPHPQR